LDRDVTQLQEELALQRFGRAREVIHRVEAEDRRKGLLLQALLLYHKADRNRALEYLRRLEEDGYRHPALNACRARLFLDWSHPEGALDDARLAATGEPDNEEYCDLLARTLGALGRTPEALQVLRGWGVERLAGPSLLLLGDLQATSLATEDALQAYLEAFRRTPLDPEPIRRIGRLCLKSGQVQRGVDILNEIMGFSALAGADAFVELARLLLVSGRRAELTALVQSRLAAPEASGADLAWAVRLFLACGGLADARSALGRAVASSSDSAKAASDKPSDKPSPELRAELGVLEGVLLWMEGRPEDARVALEKALPGLADPAPALLDLAFLLLWTPRDPPLALVRSLLERARVAGARPDDLGVHEVLVLLREGRVEHARDLFRSVVARGGEGPKRNA
jgi:hypothetical protein